MKYLIPTITWMNLENIFEVKGANHNRPHILRFCLYAVYRIGKFIDRK